MEQITVNGKAYGIIRLLGKGKGGYSYLARRGENEYVVKQIHHEPCAYYQFGDKMQSELNDYGKLSALGILMPRLLDADKENERLVKEYIEGETAAEIAAAGRMKPEYIAQVKRMCALLYPAGLNIDYWPTNFVVRDETLYYIDYECSSYSDEWNFENWGSRYWQNS